MMFSSTVYQVCLLIELPSEAAKVFCSHCAALDECFCVLLSVMSVYMYVYMYIYMYEHVLVLVQIHVNVVHVHVHVFVTITPTTHCMSSTATQELACNSSTDSQARHVVEKWSKPFSMCMCACYYPCCCI